MELRTFFKLFNTEVWSEDSAQFWRFDGKGKYFTDFPLLPIVVYDGLYGKQGFPGEADTVTFGKKKFRLDEITYFFWHGRKLVVHSIRGTDYIDVGVKFDGPAPDWKNAYLGFPSEDQEVIARMIDYNGDIYGFKEVKRCLVEELEDGPVIVWREIEEGENDE